jgi:hypothetical protein
VAGVGLLRRGHLLGRSLCHPAAALLAARPLGCGGVGAPCPGDAKGLPSRQASEEATMPSFTQRFKERRAERRAKRNSRSADRETDPRTPAKQARSDAGTKVIEQDPARGLRSSSHLRRRTRYPAFCRFFSRRGRNGSERESRVLGLPHLRRPTPAGRPLRGLLYEIRTCGSESPSRR